MQIKLKSSSDMAGVEQARAFRETCPDWRPELAVRCPTKNYDGSTATEIVGCGSANVVWDGDVYDCLDCGIFFSDFAADPPHKRPRED